MANPVIMPRQGQSVEACIITTWHKKAGDPVQEGELLFSYETDKSAFDEKSPFTGTVLAVMAAEGDVVPCLDTVCIIGETGEDISSLAPAAEVEAEDGAAVEEIKAEAAVMAAPSAEPTGRAGDVLRISPRARALALQTGADMTRVVPTGPHGRIIQRDIDAVLDQGYITGVAAVEDFLAGKISAPLEAPTEEPVAAALASPVQTGCTDFGAYTEEPMSGVRKAISRSMCASLSQMAQLTLNASFDATAMLEYRKQLKTGAEAMGLPKITLNDMILFAVSRVLLRHPYINANLVDDSFRLFSHANVGLAVDTPRGLLVPTIFGADTMSLAGVSNAAKEAAAKAREGSLAPDEMSGGSFTVTNLGSLGIESFTPVINPPQTAILGVCAVTQRLREDGSVYPAMGLSLTFDHRAVDGAPAAKFLADLCSVLENFSLLLAQ